MFESFLGVNPWTALFTLLNTLTIFLVGRKFLFGPVMKMIADRQREIDETYAQAEEAKASAQAMETEYTQKLAQAAQTGERLVKEAVERGQAREEEILRQAQTQAEAIREKASQDALRERKKALNDAKDEISVIALSIAGKVVGRELNAQDNDKLVEGFLHQLEDGV